MRYSTYFTLFLLLFFSDLTMANKPYRGAEYRTIESVTYGRFEVKMKSAFGDGIVSSFFTYHDYDDWDNGQNWNEIDIEILGKDIDTIQFNTITPGQVDHVFSQQVQFNPHEEFYTYAFEWTPDYVAWFVDSIEVYRQEGGHIYSLNKAQKIMLNIWPPIYEDWVGTLDPNDIPFYAFYDWVTYYNYSPGTGSYGTNNNFDFSWNDDFDSFDTLRWQKATHTWDGNNSSFISENVVFAGGYMVLCLTNIVDTGYNGDTSLIGNVIWEENFDNLDNWMILTGNGSWGWGNGELQFYKEENVVIAEVPGEPGNNALHITALEESGAGIVDQWGNPLNYTSAKVTTKSKVSVQYGVIETRVRVPDLELGGWPAVWLLGTSNLGWPRSGEIDIMEMGSRQNFRDLHDEHNGGNDSNNSTVNQVVGANAIFYSDDAIVADNPLGAASISWDPDDDYCRPYYNYDNLNGRFLIYRIYWDADSIRFTVIDDEVEYDLYTHPFPIDSVSEEFQRPFYFIANLAIGGSFTDAYNLGESGLPISIPLPAHMYVDYIKVMEWNGQGEVHIGPPTFQGGTFGLFTDTTPIDKGLVAGDDAEIYVWEGTLTEGSISPYEGENGISWQTTGLGWFGAGIMSMQPVNLFNFGEGHLKFMINIPANISFQIGIIDAWGNQSYVDFPANQTTYGLVRDGNWGQASIPVEDIRGEWIDLQMLSYEFVILEVNGASCEFGLDDIYWDGGGAVSVIEDDYGKPSTKYSLNNNYPNPFNPVTTLRYDLPENGHVNITIYDMLGRQVKTLINQTQDAGYKSVIWNATNDYGKPVSAGIYLYQIQTGEYISTKKMVLLK